MGGIYSIGRVPIRKSPSRPFVSNARNDGGSSKDDDEVENASLQGLEAKKIQTKIRGMFISFFVCVCVPRFFFYYLLPFVCRRTVICWQH